MYVANVPVQVGDRAFPVGSIVPEPTDGRDYAAEVRAHRMTQIPDALIQAVAALVVDRLSEPLAILQAGIDDIRAQLSAERGADLSPVGPKGVRPGALVHEADAAARAKPGPKPRTPAKAPNPPPPAGSPAQLAAPRPKAETEAADAART